MDRSSRLPESSATVHTTKQQCSVCLESFAIGDRFRTLPCFHLFHTPCIDTWLQESSECPNCRHACFSSEDEEDDDDDDDDEDLDAVHPLEYFDNYGGESDNYEDYVDYM